MVDACKVLGVDVMTAHWEFTLGAERVKQVIEKDFKGKIDFVAQNVSTTDFNDPVFAPYVIKQINWRGGGDRRPGISVHADRQSASHGPRLDLRHQGAGTAEGRGRGDGRRARRSSCCFRTTAWTWTSKLAGRVTGIDAILGGHTHDGVPQAIEVKNAKGVTLVTNAGSNGKFLGVLDFDVKAGRIAGWKYRLLPVFANLLAPDPAMAALITKIRAPHEAKLTEKLAVTEGLLYRRGSFNGTVDQVILDALMKVKGAEIAFSPGFRWGTTLLPGQAITMDHVMDWTAITYPQTTVNELSGEMIKTILEDVGDNLFNPDPYYQQGGDMVRVGGLTYTCTPGASMGQRITDMRLGGQADRGRAQVQGGRLGPRGRGRQGRADLGGRHHVPARSQDRRAPEAQPAEAGRGGRQPRDGLMRSAFSLFAASLLAIAATAIAAQGVPARQGTPHAHQGHRARLVRAGRPGCGQRGQRGLQLERRLRRHRRRGGRDRRAGLAFAGKRAPQGDPRESRASRSAVSS